MLSKCSWVPVGRWGNTVLANFLRADPVPEQGDDIRRVPISTDLPNIDPAEILNKIYVPQIMRDNETQCPITTTNGNSIVQCIV